MTQLENDVQSEGRSDAARMAIIAIAASLYLASLWVLIALDNGLLDTVPTVWRLGIILSASVLVMMISVLWLQTIGMTSPKDEPIAPSTKRAKRAIILSLVLGLIIGVMFFAWPQNDATDWTEIAMFSNGPVPVRLSIVIAALYTAGMIYGCWSWMVNIDEHERASINAGLYGSVLVYCTLTPAWWILQRGDLVPDQDPMIMYTLILTIFTAIWTYKRGS